jgi:uncharacterized protein
MKFAARNIKSAFLFTALAGSGIVALSASASSKTANLQLPNGQMRNIAVYITMRDKVRIAADIWLPENYDGTNRLPAILETTRYWRASRKGNKQSAEMRSLNEHGYAYVIVDARGSGASFGSRRMEWAPEEVADMREVVDWIVHQPWSSGRVGGMGVSYSGNTAELLAATGHPAVKAVAPLYSDFDAGSFMPGGVTVTGFLGKWFASNAALDANDICGLAKVAGFPCFMGKALVGGVKPVDGLDGERLLAEAVIEHRKNIDLSKAISQMPFAGDRTDTGLSIADVSPFSYRAAIEASKVPMFVRVGWFDGATVAGALGRFNTFNNTQKLSIGAYSHGGMNDTDPFNDKKAKVSPAPPEQLDQVIRFFDCHLKDRRPNPSDPLCSPEKAISYYTMGTGRWTSASQWPVPGVAMHKYFLAPGHLLSPSQAQAAVARDRYRVDFSATTGRANRWATQSGGPDVVYGDRVAQDAKLLTYTSPATTADIQIMGQPVISLKIASDQPDGVVHAYLEDVAPDGRVTYLTEGVIRLSLRAQAANMPYWQASPYHKLHRSDYTPMNKGQMVDLSFAMYPTSALIRRGHRIRVAIAGADQDFYERIPASGDQTFEIFTGGTETSLLELPVVM